MPSSIYRSPPAAQRRRFAIPLRACSGIFVDVEEGSTLHEHGQWAASVLSFHGLPSQRTHAVDEASEVTLNGAIDCHLASFAHRCEESTTFSGGGSAAVKWIAVGKRRVKVADAAMAQFAASRAKLVDVVGDGACQFRAVALSLYGSQDTHVNLRIMAVQEIVASRDRYEEFVRDVGFDNYVRQMQQPDCWGDHFALLVLASALFIQFDVVNLHTGYVSQVIPSNERVERTIMLAHIPEAHYMALVQTQDVPVVAEREEPHMRRGHENVRWRIHDARRDSWRSHKKGGQDEWLPPVISCNPAESDEPMVTKYGCLKLGSVSVDSLRVHLREGIETALGQHVTVFCEHKVMHSQIPFLRAELAKYGLAGAFACTDGASAREGSGGVGVVWRAGAAFVEIHSDLLAPMARCGKGHCWRYPD